MSGPAARRVGTGIAALHGKLAQHRPRVLRFGVALQALRAKRREGEEGTGQGARRRADDDAVRPGQCLQAGGEVGRVTDDRALGSRRTARRGDDPRRDADPTAQRRRPGAGQHADRAHDLEPGADGALGGVLERNRVAEVGGMPSPVLASWPRSGRPRRKHRDSGRARPAFLRVEARGARGRIDEVDERHRHRPALDRRGCAAGGERQVARRSRRSRRSGAGGRARNRDARDRGRSARGRSRGRPLHAARIRGTARGRGSRATLRSPSRPLETTPAGATVAQSGAPAPRPPSGNVDALPERDPALDLLGRFARLRVVPDGVLVHRAVDH